MPVIVQLVPDTDRQVDIANANADVGQMDVGITIVIFNPPPDSDYRSP